MRRNIDLLKLGAMFAAVVVPEACRAASVALFGKGDGYKEKLALFYGSYLSFNRDTSAALGLLSLGSSLICYKAITSKTPLSCALAMATCVAQALISNYIYSSDLTR